MFIHIVLFKLKDPDVTTAEVVARLESLRDTVPTLRYLEIGVDVLRGAASYDVSLLAHFDSRDDHDAYQVHPAHQAVNAYLRTVTTSTVKVDYES